MYEYPYKGFLMNWRKTRALTADIGQAKHLTLTALVFRMAPATCSLLNPQVVTPIIGFLHRIPSSNNQPVFSLLYRVRERLRIVLME